jgi:hypothetical protein
VDSWSEDGTMSRARKIEREPKDRNFYLLDASFLANKYIPTSKITDAREKQRVERSKFWWREIDKQLQRRKAIIYVPDICIAEAFKVLARKYYQDNYFSSSNAYKGARDKLSADIHISPKNLKSSNRYVKFHDISTSRDIIISVDRFFEVFAKYKLNVTVPDLIILATAKYLIDFYNVPQKQLFIVTLDNALWQGSKRIPDIPSAFNPNRVNETDVFV